MKRKRLAVISKINAAQISRVDGVITVADVVPIVNDIVMNGGLYPTPEIANSYLSLNDRPAPAGHPTNDDGQYVSASSGQALAKSWIGAYCVNARHEEGRVLVDVKINQAAAEAHKEGKELVGMLERAMSGESMKPIHVSTGLTCRAVEANGESNGKGYTWIASDIQFDHLAILLHEPGAGTPEEGVGMFLNAAGVELAFLNAAEDAKDCRKTNWLKRLLWNSSKLSFDEIRMKLSDALKQKFDAWVYPYEVYDNSVVFEIENTPGIFETKYALVDDKIELLGDPVEVKRVVEYKPVVSNSKENVMKDMLVAALNAASIKTDGLSDAQLLAAYNELQLKPVRDQLDAINAERTKQEQAELRTLAERVHAVNQAIPVDQWMGLGKEALSVLASNTQAAAPVVLGAVGATPRKYKLPE